MPSRVMTADFAGRAVAGNLSALWVNRCFGVHDTAVLHYIRRARPPGAPAEVVPAPGTPVQIAFGRAPGDVALWQGYVHHHANLPGASQERPLLEIVAMGTSYVLSTERARSHNETTVTALAETMAAAAGLRAVVSGAPRKRAMIVQAGRSDFSMLNEAARAEGLRLWVGNGLLQLIEPATLFHRGAAVGAPVFGADASGRNAVVSFTVIEGEPLTSADGDPRARSAYGFTGLRSRSTYRAGPGGDAPLTAIDTAQDLSDLGQVLGATFTPASAYSVEVSARLSDGQHLRPGALVDIADAQVRPEHRGRWLVTAAAHDADWPQGVYTTVRLVRTGDGRGRPATLSAASERAAAYLAGVTWRAAVQGVERV